MSRSQVELLRDLLRADRRPDLEEQAVRLAELALAGGVVAGQAGELGALDVEDRLVALRPRARRSTKGPQTAFEVNRTRWTRSLRRSCAATSSEAQLSRW